MAIPFKKKYAGHPVVKEVYIECGTWEGKSVSKASEHFEICHTIEIIEDVFERAKENLASRKNIHLHLGHSLDVLPEIVDPDKETTFFLDSHFTWSYEETKDCVEIAGTECPLLEEAEYLSGLNWTVPHMIFVDDWNMFFDSWWTSKRAGKYDRSQWPKAEEVIEVLKDYEYTNLGRQAVFASTSSSSSSSPAPDA